MRDHPIHGPQPRRNRLVGAQQQLLNLGKAEGTQLQVPQEDTNLVDGGNQAAEEPTTAQRGVGLLKEQPGLPHVQDDGIEPLLVEPVFGIAHLERDIGIQPHALQVLLCGRLDIGPGLITVDVAIGLDHPGERQGQAAAAGAGLQDVGPWTDVHLHQHVANLFGIDDLRGTVDIADHLVEGGRQNGIGIPQVGLDALAPATADHGIMAQNTVVCLVFPARLHPDDRGLAIRTGKKDEVAFVHSDTIMWIWMDLRYTRGSLHGTPIFFYKSLHPHYNQRWTDLNLTGVCMPDETIDRMAITIVDGGQSRDLMKALGELGYPVTTLDAVGGFLHEAMVTLIVGMSEQRLPKFFSLLREKCPSRIRYVPMGVELSLSPGYPMMIEARVGGATVFVLPVERFVQL